MNTVTAYMDELWNAAKYRVAMATCRFDMALDAAENHGISKETAAQEARAVAEREIEKGNHRRAISAIQQFGFGDGRKDIHRTLWDSIEQDLDRPFVAATKMAGYVRGLEGMDEDWFIDRIDQQYRNELSEGSVDTARNLAINFNLDPGPYDGVVADMPGYDALGVTAEEEIATTLLDGAGEPERLGRTVWGPRYVFLDEDELTRQYVDGFEAVVDENLGEAAAHYDPQEDPALRDEAEEAYSWLRSEVPLKPTLWHFPATSYPCR